MVCVRIHVGFIILFVLLRFLSENEIFLPPVVKSLVDVDFVTIATDSLMECLQPLITVSFTIDAEGPDYYKDHSKSLCHLFQTPLFTSLAPRDLVSVRMARAVIQQPQPFSQDDHTR